MNDDATRKRCLDIAGHAEHLAAAASADDYLHSAATVVDQRGEQVAVADGVMSLAVASGMVAEFQVATEYLSSRMC